MESSFLISLGINQAFKITSETVGTGQAIGSKVRDASAAQAIIQQEIGRYAVIGTDEPFLIIESQARAAFRNAADENSDRDWPGTD